MGGGDLSNAAFNLNFGSYDYQYKTLFVWTNTTYESGAQIRSIAINDKTLTNKNTIHYTNGKLTYGTQSLTLTKRTNTQAGPLHLFENFSRWDVYLYGFKILENSKPILDLIPVRKGNTGYLYDKVNDKIYSNMGTGDFILGQDL